MSVRYKFSVSDLYVAGKVRESDVDKMRKWTQETDGLPKYPDEMLALFLVACFNKLEEAKKCAANYHKMRNGCPEVFANRTVTNEGVVRQNDVVEMAVLPLRTKENYVVLFGRYKDTNPWHYDDISAAKLFYMAIETVTYENPPKGIILVLDCRGFSFMHLTRIHLSVYKKMVLYVQEGINLKIMGVHCVNVNWIVDKLLKLLRPFIRPEIFEFIYLHTSSMDMNWFYENYVPKECVPSDYGGDAESMKELHDVVWNKMKDMEEFYKEEEKLRTNTKNDDKNQLNKDKETVDS